MALACTRVVCAATKVVFFEEDESMVTISTQIIVVMDNMEATTIMANMVESSEQFYLMAIASFLSARSTFE